MSAIERFRMFYQSLDNASNEGLGDIYSDDVIFIDPIATHKGLTELQHYFDHLLASTEQCTFSIHEIVESSDRVHIAVAWTMVMTLKRQQKKIKVD